ncbi:MAG: hypothetical protein WCI52_03175 [bacterium]
MKKLQDFAVGFFILMVVVMTGIAIFGIWNVLTHDVILKAYKTLSLISIATFGVLIAGYFIDRKTNEIEPANPVFRSIRYFTVVVFIVAVVVLVLLGVLSIWEVLSADALAKALSSIGIIAFSSLVTVVFSLEREHSKLIYGETNQTPTGFVALIVLISLFFLVSLSW